MCASETSVRVKNTVVYVSRFSISRFNCFSRYDGAGGQGDDTLAVKRHTRVGVIDVALGIALGRRHHLRFINNTPICCHCGGKASRKRCSGLVQSSAQSTELPRLQL